MGHTKSGSPAAIACALMAAAASLLLGGCEKNYYYLSEDTDSLPACISNQKQIVAAAKMYADDWDSTFPCVGDYSNWFYGAWDPGDAPQWMVAIRDYVKASPEVFQCPLVEQQPSPSYAWSRHLTAYPEALIQYPHTTPLCWDWVPGRDTAPGIPLDPGWSGLGEWGYYPTNTGASNAEMARACSRHREGSSLPGGLVVAFTDGHARLVIPTRWTPETTSGRFMPCDDGAMPWVPADYRGIVISMYPADPNW
jgi:hypothetical protein